MGQYMPPASWDGIITEIRRRLGALERAKTNPTPSYTTATLPDPTTCAGLIVLDSTTGTHKGSNGTVWTALY